MKTEREQKEKEFIKLRWRIDKLKNRYSLWLWGVGVLFFSVLWSCFYLSLDINKSATYVLLFITLFATWLIYTPFVLGVSLRFYNRSLLRVLIERTKSYRRYEELREELYSNSGGVFSISNDANEPPTDMLKIPGYRGLELAIILLVNLGVDCSSNTCTVSQAADFCGDKKRYGSRVESIEATWQLYEFLKQYENTTKILTYKRY